MTHRGLQRSLAGGQPGARGIVLLAFFLLLTSASCQQPSPDTSPPTPGTSPTVTDSAQANTVGPEDADFDADGHPDLALGSGLRTVGEYDDDGVVIVVYGSADGLITRRTQAWSESDFGGPLTESFGDALAVGDFDGDGFSDLAIGRSDAPVDAAKQHAGFVRVIYGSETGLDVARSQRWTQNSPGVADKAESNDGYGNALAAADFGLGTQDDLAVGIHGENHDAGAVHVLYGSPDGLSAERNQLWTQASPGVADEPETDDAFGLTVVPGQFRDSGLFDLAIGVYNESVGEAYSTGAVHVLNGSRNGLTADGSVFLTQDLPEHDGPGLGAAFSFSMAAGRFSGGPTDDLAVGAPFTRNNSGTVHVYRGTADGLRADNPQIWSQSTPGVAGRPESDDTFGWSLATGQFGRDVGEREFEDLAVRVPGEETDSTDAGGAVMVIYGSPSGLAVAGSRTFTKEFKSESYGIDVTWSQQLTAVRGAGGLDRLVVGHDEWEHVMTPGSTGLDAGSQQTWTAKSLGHPEVWTGLADAVGG